MKTQAKRQRFDALLFDLDGTLLDSAPDLAGAVNDMRASRGLMQVPYERLRPHAGSGARGMLGAGFDLPPQHADYAAHRDEFHDRYEARMLQATQPFDGIAALLGQIQKLGLPCGIVTNKALRFAVPLVRAFGELVAVNVLVGGDSTPHTKPHPAPLLEAARQLDVAPERCVYIGDDLRDMLAARAAGMGAWAAAWGYLGLVKPIEAWGADAVLHEPLQILQRLDVA